MESAVWEAHFCRTPVWKHFGLEIVAAFDVDPTLVGTNLNGIPIYHSDDFLKKMEEYDVQIGVLTVPIEIAQCITDMMVDGESRQSGTYPVPYPCT